MTKAENRIVFIDKVVEDKKLASESGGGCQNPSRHKFYNIYEIKKRFSGSVRVWNRKYRFKKILMRGRRREEDVFCKTFRKRKIENKETEEL